jgi:hypothetical protein
VLHNYVTAEKKYLPASYVVNTWGATAKKDEVLRSSTAFHQTWRQVGGLDLPATLLVVTATGATQTAAPAPGATPRTLDCRSLRLANHKLAK